MTDRQKIADGDGAEFSLIPRETLLALYDGLRNARERRAATRGQRGSRGEVWKFAAAAIAVGQDLVPGDTVIADCEITALRQAKVSARGFAAELERAAGIALGHKTKKTGKVTVVFGGTNEAWRDALEVARVHKLPIVFVAELREENHPAQSLCDLEPGTELARIVVDGHDTVASYRVAYEAIQRARRDRGATLIECAAYRIKGRRQQDSVAMMKTYLVSKRLLDPRAKRTNATRNA